MSEKEPLITCGGKAVPVVEIWYTVHEKFPSMVLFVLSILVIVISPFGDDTLEYICISTWDGLFVFDPKFNDAINPEAAVTGVPIVNAPENCRLSVHSCSQSFDSMFWFATKTDDAETNDITRHSPGICSAGLSSV